MASARETADKLGIYQTLENKGLSSDPDIIKMLLSLNDKISEDTLTPSAPGGTLDKTAEQRLEEIKIDPAFTDKFHHKHKEIMREYLQVCTAIENSRRQAG